MVKYAKVNPNSVSLTTPTCKNSGGYLQTASAQFKELATSHANITEGSVAFPLRAATAAGWHCGLRRAPTVIETLTAGYL